MDEAAVSHLIGLIPERTTRSLSGTLFNNAGSDRAELLSRFLNWLGPISPLSKDEQQLFGLRAPAAKPHTEDEEEPDMTEELEDSPISQAESGTQIAA